MDGYLSNTDKAAQYELLKKIAEPSLMYKVCAGFFLKTFFSLNLNHWAKCLYTFFLSDGLCDSSV